MRTIVAVVIGYVVMAAIVMGGHAVSWARLGANEAFAPGGWEVTPRWIAISLVLGMIAAIAGGFVCAWIGRGLRPARILGVAVFAMGLVVAFAELGADPAAAPRPPGDIPMAEAIRNSRAPLWVAFANALIGATGVLLGAQRRQMAVDATAGREEREG